ncbi:MAG: hypothetical protein JW994_02060 [Candidatus Omnitrophica bacterium]|nr:hypothetical protein [Candidatus Omnitrophota bacterium]
MITNTKVLIAAVFLFLSVIAAIYNIIIFPWMLDDSFIFFRYADNLCAGNGLVYNPGEKVEGYTSFLWILLLAAGNCVGFSPVFFSKFLGAVFSAGCVLLLLNTHRFIKNTDYTISVTSALFLGTCGVFMPWAASGMETAMFTFFVLLSCLFYLSIREGTRERWMFFLLGNACALSTMSRPEGAIIFSVIFFDRLYIDIKTGRRMIFYATLGFLAVYLPYFIWRYLYYGDLFPNSFYVKVNPIGQYIALGLLYAFKFIRTVFFLLFPIFILAAFPRKWRTINKNIKSLTILLAAYTVYIIAVGGDCMPSFRFFAPILPVICVVSAMLLSYFMDKKSMFVFAVSMVCIYNFIQLPYNDELLKHVKGDGVVCCGKEAGLWLKKNVSPEAVIATNTAGSVAHYSRLKIIDMLGLTDRHIAHRKIQPDRMIMLGHDKADGNYVLSKKPDYIMFGAPPGEEYPRFQSDYEIYGNPEFNRMYELKTYPLESGNTLIIYGRKHN